jgi:hypothetical protein
MSLFVFNKLFGGENPIGVSLVEFNQNKAEKLSW